MNTIAGSIPLSAPADSADRRRRIIAIIAASSGNLVEWYDFYAYAFTSIYFASAFFPSGDATSQLLGTAGHPQIRLSRRLRTNRAAKNRSRPVGVAPATALRS